MLLVITIITLLGFGLLVVALVLIVCFSQRWIDEYQARRGRGRGGPSAAELYMDSVRAKDKSG